MMLGSDPESRESRDRHAACNRHADCRWGWLSGLLCHPFRAVPETLNRSLATYFEMPAAWPIYLGLVVLYKFGDALALSLSTPLLRLMASHFSQTAAGIC